MTDPHIHEYDYDDGNTTDSATIYANVEGKDIPFDERFMKLDDVLSTDYQVTNEELADHDAAEISDTGLPLKLEEFKDFAARREAYRKYKWLVGERHTIQQQIWKCRRGFAAEVVSCLSLSQLKRTLNLMTWFYIFPQKVNIY